MTCPKCPNCGRELENFECIDTEWFGGTYYDTITGSCSHCNKDYIWIEVFKYHHSEDLKELGVK